MTIRLCALLVLAGCATATVTATVPGREAVADFVAVRQLEDVGQIRKGRDDGWSRVNDYYAVYTTRQQSYLLMFARRCPELEETKVVADRRWDPHTLRARFDTLRGCRIKRIYGLSCADLVELRSLGKPPSDGT
jgi:hypothetical protein